MAFQAKLEVLQRFMEFVEGYIPRRKAFFATLGGEGLEAALWQELKLLPEQGWLIECKRDRSRRLIHRFPYRYCSRLDSFSDLFRSVRSSKGRGIDGFHLDLCGTFEANDEAFSPVIPLIARSKGKCLAVTVADQRRNLSLEDFGAVLADAGEILEANVAECFFERLEAEHRRLPELTEIGLYADPTIGAKREFALALRLIRLLAENRAPRIERMERYHYVSHTPKPFRMRTYFFRLTEGRGRRFLLPAYAREAISVWNKSNLAYVGEKGLINVSQRKERKESMKTGPMAAKYHHLERLARAAGGEYQNEFEALLREAAFGSHVGQAIKGFSAVESLTVASSVRSDLPKNGKGILLQVSLMRAMAEGREVYDKTLKEAKRTHGFKGKSGNRKLGALYARTQGKFRGNFISRVIVHLGDDSASVLEELAGIYSKLCKSEVTVGMLREEARQVA